MTRKIAVIVGPNGGIGSAIIEAVRASGNYDEVVGLGRKSAPPLDLLDETTIEACAEHLRSLAGEVRLVFDASGALTLDGTRPEKSWREIDPAHLARSYAVNAIGPALLMKHFLPLFPREGRGLFATLSARVGSIGDNRLGGWYAYRAAKAGLNQILRTAAVELARRNPEAIAVALHPGTVRTQLTETFAKSGLDVRNRMLRHSGFWRFWRDFRRQKPAGFRSPWQTGRLVVRFLLNKLQILPEIESRDETRFEPTSADLMTDPFFHPVSGFDLPRFAGVPTFMRLPHVALDDAKIAEVEIGLIGAPWDGGTTNRPGPRHGPRQLRDMSTMIRAQNGATGVRPFELTNCADLGDVGPNPASVDDSLTRMTAFYDRVRDQGIRPLTAGGDHLCSLPILRALAKDRPLGMIHFDSHTDLFKSYFGGMQYTHGTPFRRAVEEGLLDPKRVIQIGIRGTAYDSEDRDFADSVGIRVVPIEEFHARGPDDVMVEAREIAGSQDTYVSYDIDFVDPAFAPGTGTPEVGGPNSFQALQVARLLEGVNIVGADLVEVSPPFDQAGATAFLGVSIMFEILCNMAIAAKK